MFTCRTTYLVFFLAFIFFVIIYLEDVKKSLGSYYTEVEEEEDVLNGQINSSFPIIFYHNAYVDHRSNPPRLRIFSLNGCTDKANFLIVDVFYEGIKTPIKLKMYSDSLEGNCPSTYGPAKPCFYVAHTFFAELTATGGITKVSYKRGVILRMGRREVQLSIKDVDRRYEKGITLCLQPVYYYTQWQNIVLYIEAWRAQGATRFIVFYHSSTQDTRKVLDYYQNLGLLEIRSWPNFGDLPIKAADKYPKIDESAFIFSYFLAMNICVLDIKTSVGSIADFDEIMVPRNGTTLEYALKEMVDTDVGALSFENNYVAMEPSIYSSDFSGVSKPIFFERGGPRKYIFNASVIDLCQVHWVRSFIDQSKKSKNADGALIHLRFNAKDFKEKRVSKPFQFFPSNTSQHIQNMKTTYLKNLNQIRNIFGTSPPEVPLNVIDVINKCVDRIGEKGLCHSTGGLCKADMDKAYDWVYDETKGLFL
ncbi:hypothetical protein CRE_18586 [Caenorhabditis remanei]|uniref:Glycosyltransferase family 92 protein n=1 Tax=Caenorhabditis remanei TaxID=31234 RepID=E3LK05_CAERE|nr:hypothetical protein CRE_18586 [Caenorhabditis remanei]